MQAVGRENSRKMAVQVGVKGGLTVAGRREGRPPH